MKKSTFYTCNRNGYGKIEIEEKEGYVIGDIGVSKNGKFWTGTHIETGLRLFEWDTPEEAIARSAEILKSDYLLSKLESIRETEYHKRFIELREAEISQSLYTRCSCCTRGKTKKELIKNWYRKDEERVLCPECYLFLESLILDNAGWLDWVKNEAED